MSTRDTQLRRALDAGERAADACDELIKECDRLREENEKLYDAWIGTDTHPRHAPAECADCDAIYALADGRTG